MFTPNILDCYIKFNVCPNKKTETCSREQQARMPYQVN